MRDHIHMCIEIPPKHLVSSVIGLLKGKSALVIGRQFNGKHRNFNGENFWARGSLHFITVTMESSQLRLSQPPIL